MKVITDNSIKHFEFWSGASKHNFTWEEMDTIETCLEDLYPDGLTDTELNDLFWFEEEFLCDIIGLKHSEYFNR